MRTQYSMLLGLFVTSAASVVGCSGGSAPSAASEAELLDVSRSDVIEVTSAEGDVVGLLNTSHGLLLDYERGYAQLDDTLALHWGFEAEVPEAKLFELAELDERGEQSWHAEAALALGATRSNGFGPALRQSDGTAPTRQCSVDVGKDYTCIECSTAHTTTIYCFPTPVILKPAEAAL